MKMKLKNFNDAEATRTSAQSRSGLNSHALTKRMKQLVQVHRAEDDLCVIWELVALKQLVQVHRAEDGCCQLYLQGLKKQLVQVHRAEVNVLGYYYGVCGSNSYKCTEQKLRCGFEDVTGSRSNSYKCTEQK